MSMKNVLFSALLLLFLFNESSAILKTEYKTNKELHKAVATAYALKGITRSGKRVGHGHVAADPKVLPLGSKIQIIEPKEVAGIYTVTDTGAKIKKKRIDIWMPSVRKCIQFGRRTVNYIVLKVGK